MFQVPGGQNGAAASGEGDEAFIPEPSSEEVATPPDQQAPQFLTKAEFESSLQTFSDGLLRRVQSMTDKASNRIQQRFTELQAANAQALTTFKQLPGVTPEQVAAAERQFREQAMQQAIQGEQQAGGNGQGAGGGDELKQQQPTGEDMTAMVSQVNAQASTLFTRFGLKEGDPEMKTIKTDGTAQEYLDSVWSAGVAKVARAGAPNQRPARPSQIPGLGPGNSHANTNPIANVNSEDDLLDMQWQQMKKRSRS